MSRATVPLAGRAPRARGRPWVRGRAHILDGVPYVYILRCGDGSLYTGVTINVARRLAQHRNGRASRYTRSRPPVELVWQRRVASWRTALREEHRIKSLSRERKLELVGDRSS